MIRFGKSTVRELSALLMNREVSSTELAKGYLDRIKEYDPAIESYITVCEKEAMDAAKSAGQADSGGRKRGFAGNSRRD